MAKVRRIYTREFKLEVVKLVTDKGYSTAEAARSLGLHKNRIRSWKQAFQKQGQQAFPGQGKLSLVDEENQRLRAENKRPQAKRDIKKAAAFFARETP
jgi:transposase